MNKVGILFHPKVEATQIKARELQKFLESGGVSVWLCSAWEEEQVRAKLNNTDLILTVGGDGTILRAAQVVIPGTLPIAGVNLGKLGFMTEINADKAEERLPLLLKGKTWVDERAVLEADLITAEQEPRQFHALNDIVVARGAVARVVYVEALIDGQLLTTYKADGVIVATATGSTGYSMAAGGPVLYPRSRDFLLLPILPHLSTDYILVLPSTVTVELRIATAYLATLSIDGHTNLPLSDGDVIKIKQSPNTVRFLRILPEISYYGSLEQKLKGKK